MVAEHVDGDRLAHDHRSCVRPPCAPRLGFEMKLHRALPRAVPRLGFEMILRSVLPRGSPRLGFDMKLHRALPWAVQRLGFEMALHSVCSGVAAGGPQALVLKSNPKA